MFHASTDIIIICLCWYKIAVYDGSMSKFSILLQRYIIYPKSFFSIPPTICIASTFFSHLRNCTTFVRFQKIVSLNFCRIQIVLVLLWYRQFRTAQMFLLVLLILLAITNHRKDENRNRSKLKQSNICRKSLFFSF